MTENSISKPLDEIFRLTLKNEELRDGEKIAIYNSLKEIQGIWSFAK